MQSQVTLLLLLSSEFYIKPDLKKNLFNFFFFPQVSLANSGYIFFFLPQKVRKSLNCVAASIRAPLLILNLLKSSSNRHRFTLEDLGGGIESLTIPLSVCVCVIISSTVLATELLNFIQAAAGWSMIPNQRGEFRRHQNTSSFVCMWASVCVCMHACVCAGMYLRGTQGTRQKRLIINRVGT